jgi:hypothetical protein
MVAVTWKFLALCRIQKSHKRACKRPSKHRVSQMIRYLLTYHQFGGPSSKSGGPTTKMVKMASLLENVNTAVAITWDLC